MPGMAKTTCKKIGFLMEGVTDIEGEMNMWEKEFRKYFIVHKADTEESIIEKMRL